MHLENLHYGNMSMQAKVDYLYFLCLKVFHVLIKLLLLQNLFFINSSFLYISFLALDCEILMLLNFSDGYEVLIKHFLGFAFYFFINLNFGVFILFF